MAEVAVSGEDELRRMVDAWRMQVASGPGTRPTMDELGEPDDERERAELQSLIDGWDQEWEDDRHRRLVARVEFTEGLLRLWDAVNPRPPSTVDLVCTGTTATWCPVHGDCTCDRHEDGEVDFDSLGSCPLHSHGAEHPIPGEDDAGG